PKQVSVIGWVNNPGKYDMFPERETTILEAIAMAGGFHKNADVNGTRILRMEDGKEKTIFIKVKTSHKKGRRIKTFPCNPTTSYSSRRVSFRRNY
ncbi:MAG: SLBB domain-containing protein, partial [Candidatus Omnitrophota bacterium]|nr:SLBB domain-containing protein [Candidatus Omnitrophota bacterium]